MQHVRFNKILDCDFDILCRTLEQLNIGSSDVVCVPKSTPAYKAFAEVARNKVYGVAVVGSEGQLWENLSASNIKVPPIIIFQRLQNMIRE
jgi:hypothetical protein